MLLIIKNIILFKGGAYEYTTSRILKYLNGTLFLDDAYRFCVFFILHYQDFDSYTIEEIAGELQTTPESILNFLKILRF